MSVGAIEEEGWLLDYHEDEVAVMQAMMRNARRTIALVDGSKFGKTVAHKVAPVRELGLLVTERAPGWFERMARTAPCGT